MWPTGKGKPPATITVNLTGTVRDAGTGKVAEGVVLTMTVTFTDVNGTDVLDSTNINGGPSDIKGNWSITVQGVPAAAVSAQILSISAAGSNANQKFAPWSYLTGPSNATAKLIANPTLPGSYTANFSGAVWVTDHTQDVQVQVTGECLSGGGTFVAQGVQVTMDLTFKNNNNVVVYTDLGVAADIVSDVSGDWSLTLLHVPGNATKCSISNIVISGTDPTHSNLPWFYIKGGNAANVSFTKASVGFLVKDPSSIYVTITP